MESKTRGVNLPSPGHAPGATPATTTVSSEGPIVVVGANGSGKTRLGAWIEFEGADPELVRRISAQKSLAMPASVTSTDVDRALVELTTGYPDTPSDPVGRLGYRRNQRWGQNPNIFPLSDFDKLLTYLFSEFNETNARYVAEVEHDKGRRIEPHETKLRTTRRVWEGVLPHRELVIGGGKVETRIVRPSGAPADPYNASEMSDGERVIFYLIGQALSAPENGIIIVDEPELHLHKSIQARLWDGVEAERPDCLFIYLTHDLDFAASRITATKVWLESYDGRAWNWRAVEDAEGIPKQLYLEILGGRKPVLFCEGDKGGLDYFLFQKAYPNYTVAPCGTAHEVLQATNSFSALKDLHEHDCRGIVDRDFRDDAQVDHLRRKGVHVLDQSEIENVLLCKDVMATVADHLILTDSFQRILDEAKEIVFGEVRRERERLISSICAAKVERRLKNFDAKARGKADLTGALTSLISSIDVEAIYDETATEVDRVIAERDYEQALRLYNNKGLLGKIEPLFGFARAGLPELIKRLASSDKPHPVLSALREQLPQIGA